MKTNNAIQYIILIGSIAAPFLYAWYIWDTLPAKVGTHFGADGKPDGFGSKESLLGIIGFLMVMGVLVYILNANLDKIDPKKGALYSKDTLKKIGLTIMVFFSLLSIEIIRSAERNETSNFLFLILGIFFAALGNLMHSLKPNYFVGIRVPWTLDNEENWKKTHQLGSKLWFAGGILIALLSLILSQKIMFGVFMVIMLIMTIIPIGFSYREFSRTKTQ